MPEKKRAGSSGNGDSEVIQDSPPPPSHEEIARLAYVLWQARGGGDGSAEQDWFEAERQLRVPKEKFHVA